MEPNPYESPREAAPEAIVENRDSDYALLSFVGAFGVGSVIGGLLYFDGRSGITEMVGAGSAIGGFWGLMAGVAIRVLSALLANR
jgi:hypothetical protein